MNQVCGLLEHSIAVDSDPAYILIQTMTTIAFQKHRIMYSVARLMYIPLRTHSELQCSPPFRHFQNYNAHIHSGYSEVQCSHPFMTFRTDRITDISN